MPAQAVGAHPGAGAAGASLDSATELVHDLGVTVWPEAREACIYGVPRSRRYVPPGEGVDPERARKSAIQRARSTARRYVVANRLAFMWTLTFAVEPDSDDEAIVEGERFVRRLRRATFGGQAFPYLLVLEHGSKGGRRHLHMALPRWIDHAKVQRVWGLGFVHVSGPNRAARRAGTVTDGLRQVASYVSKYLGKDWDREAAPAAPEAAAPGRWGRQRYRVGEGFAPEGVRGSALTWEAAVLWCERVMGARVAHVVEVEEAVIDPATGEVTDVRRALSLRFPWPTG